MFHGKKQLRGTLVVGTLSKIWTKCRGLGFDPRGLHKIFRQTTFNMVPHGNPCMGHVAPPNLPSTCHASKSNLSTCLPIQNLTHHLPTQLLLRQHFHMSDHTPATSACTDCTNCTVSVFFPCLANRTKRDISLIRCLFDPVWSALGSWWWGLHSCLFWGDFEHFYFWAKFWPLIQILINALGGFWLSPSPSSCTNLLYDELYPI